MPRTNDAETAQQAAQVALVADLDGGDVAAVDVAVEVEEVEAEAAVHAGLVEGVVHRDPAVCVEDLAAQAGAERAEDGLLVRAEHSARAPAGE